MYLSAEDTARIAAHLGLNEATFADRYAERGRKVLRLRKPPEKQCVFHLDNRCSIHVVKPVQCRVFPYWPEITESRERWDATARTCPGMNRGALVRIEAAKEMGAEMVRAYPSMYPQGE